MAWGRFEVTLRVQVEADDPNSAEDLAVSAAADLFITAVADDVERVA